MQNRTHTRPEACTSSENCVKMTVLEVFEGAIPKYSLSGKRQNDMSYELKSARYLAREVLERAVQPGDTVVDATMGNGHDTLMLCEAVGPTGRVYAFDIQQDAVKETEKLLQSQGMLERATLINTGHEHMKDYVKGPVNAVVFNLGWLPGGDHSITTRWETTSRAVQAALELLGTGGVLVICAYPGHGEGDRERNGRT